ncbi:MAG: helix-hairpin-helix domain-containing protein [Bacteroidales bacterium]|nr:helix-hairpin-helix domain-containing protein [Bacteroidales bacterium]
MKGEKNYRTQTGSKYSEEKKQINNSKALGVMALIALLILFQTVQLIVSKSTQKPKVAEPYKPTLEMFSFNPNTVTLDSLQMLGFTQKQAQSILNYRNKGGVFRVKKDFAKMYVVDSLKYTLLSSYILLPDKLPATKTTRKNSLDEKRAGVRKPYIKEKKNVTKDSVYGTKIQQEYRQPEMIDLNKADSTSLVGLYGIGPYYATKILRYRERLGGSFVSIHQLKEIDGFTQEKFQSIENRVCINENGIIRFSFWEIDDTFLKKHPYIGAYAARGVMLFLSRNQELRGLSGKEVLDIMEKEKVLSAEVVKRLEKYIK